MGGGWGGERDGVGRMDRGWGGLGDGDGYDRETGRAKASDDEYMARRKGWDERAADGYQQAKTKAGGVPHQTPWRKRGRRATDRSLDGKNEAALRGVKLMNACHSAEESPFPGAEARWEVKESKRWATQAT